MITKVSLIILPFLVMLICGLMFAQNINGSTTVQYNTGNQSANGQQGNLNTSPITLTSLLAISAFIGLAIGICSVLALKVLGSGVSGSIIPIVFAVTVLSGVYSLMSALAFPVFNSIPVFGLPMFFGLLTMYVVGIVSLATNSGGD